MLIYGVDCGVTGALALAVNAALRDVRPMPAHVVSTAGIVKRQVDAAGIAAIVREWRAQHGPDAELAVIERVASMPGQGVASVFSLGHSYGSAHAVMAALGVPCQLVAPQTWKRRYGLGRDKALAQALASRLYPDLAGRWAVKGAHGLAEAALLAGYGWSACA